MGAGERLWEGGPSLQHERLSSSLSSVRERCHPSGLVSPLQPGDILALHGPCPLSSAGPVPPRQLLCSLRCGDSPSSARVPSGLESEHLSLPSMGTARPFKGSCPLSGVGTAGPLGPCPLRTRVPLQHRDKSVLSGLMSHQGPCLIRAAVPSPAQPVPWTRVPAVPVCPISTGTAAPHPGPVPVRPRPAAARACSEPPRPRRRSGSL